MSLVVLAAAVLICFFISVVNLYYQKAKYKYSTDEELKRLSILESPSTWRICVVISGLILAGTIVICTAYMFGGLSTMKQQEDTTNQYQGDSSNQSTDNGQTN